MMTPSSHHATPRAGLGGVARTLRERTCRIAYVGNSVTSQRDGYVPNLHAHLEARTRRTHERVQVGLSGMGVLGSLFTLDRFVLGRRPDLCFIECSLGDDGSRTPRASIGPAVEGLIRKLRQAGCACCILHASRSDRSAADVAPIIAAYEQVADHYGVPSISLRDALQEDDDGLPPDQLFLDGIHTTAAGGRVLARLIMDTVAPMLDAAELLARAEPARLFPDGYEYARLVEPDPRALANPALSRASRFRLVLPCLEIDAGNELAMTAPGHVAGLLIVAGPHSGLIAIGSDVGTALHRTWDKWCSRDLLRTVTLPVPVASGSALRISVLDRRVLDRAEPDQAPKKVLKLAGLMVYGAPPD